MGFPYTLPLTLGGIDRSDTTNQHWPGGRWFNRRRGTSMSWVNYGPYTTVRPFPAEADAWVSDQISWIAGGMVRPLSVKTTGGVVAPSLRADRCLTVPYLVATAAAVSPLVEVLIPVSASFTFENTVPSSFAPFGTGFTVSNGIAMEKFGNYDQYSFAGGIYRTPMASPVHSAKVTMSQIQVSSDRGAGAVVGADSPSFNSGVMAIGHVLGSSSATKIYSKVGGSWVQRAANSVTWGEGDRLELRATKSLGGYYTYEVYKNGSPIGLSWIDTGRVITPGRYAGFGFRHGFFIFDWYSQGLKGTWYAADIV